MIRIGTILLVDDNDADNYLHERVIRKSGCAEEVVVRENGQEALDYLQGEDGAVPPRPDLVFLDLNMPLMNGFEFLEAYRDLDPEIRATAMVVALTTSLDPEDEKRIRATGMSTDCLRKPLTTDDLQRILEAHFGTER